MNKAEFSVFADMVVESDGKKSRMESLVFGLRCSDNCDKTVYYDPDGKPSAIGAKVISQVLIQALAGNIHSEHQKGRKDSAEHLRWAISELEKAFVQNVNVSTTEMKHG